MRTAIFPGSFDPITLGHADIVERALPLFDRIIVAIGDNHSKKYMFPVDRRETWIRGCFAGEPRVEVMRYGGLTVTFCREQQAGYIIRGLRNAADFQYEQGIAQMNRLMAPGIETVFIPCRPELMPVQSTIVRDIIRHGGSIREFVPASVVIDTPRGG